MINNYVSEGVKIVTSVRHGQPIKQLVVSYIARLMRYWLTNGGGLSIEREHSSMTDLAALKISQWTCTT
jgi:hypothetical protein